MNTFTIIMLLLFCFVVLVLAFFALSSCLGDDIRAVWNGRRNASMPTTYGLQYARSLNSGGTNLEHIEMENMLDRRLLGHDED